MSRLEEITDVKTLQQVASHLEKTTVRQSRQIARLRAEVARLRGGDMDPQLELALLKEQLAAMQREVYGSSSERRPHETKPDDSHQKAPRRGHGPKAQPSLPVEEVTHSLDEKDRICPICGETLTEMGEQVEESEEITVVGVEYKILKHRRQKYRCRCNEQVITAPGPAKLIPGGRYSVDLAVRVAESKYLDHLPLERQVGAMGRAGLDIDSQTICIKVPVTPFRHCGAALPRQAQAPAASSQLMSLGRGTGVIPWSLLSSLSFRSRPSYAPARSAPGRRLEVRWWVAARQKCQDCRPRYP